MDENEAGGPWFVTIGFITEDVARGAAARIENEIGFIVRVTDDPAVARAQLNAALVVNERGGDPS